MPTLLSVNAGRPELIPGKARPTGINKHPLTGAVAIGPLGIATDAVIDRKHHGGPDQALYLYLQSDYEWWMEELGTALPAGSFGENLTIGGLEGDALAVGDRFAIGDVVVEITSHREPCATLAARMGDPRFVRRFHRARRPGAYLRVLQPGSVEAGQQVAYTPYAGESIRLTELVEKTGARTIDPAFMHRALMAPIHYKMRADFTARLASL